MGERGRQRRRAAALLLAVSAWIPVGFAVESEPPAGPDPKRAFEARNLEPVRAWISTLDEAGLESVAGLRSRAWLARREGDLDEAMALIDRAVEQAPDRAALRVDRAAIRSDLLDEAGRFRSLRIARDIRRDLEYAVEVEPDNVAALAALVTFHREAPGIAGGDAERADALLPRLAEASPAYHRMRAAVRLADAERFGDAASTMDEALELVDEPPPKWRLRRAQWLHAAGRVQAARQALLALLAETPSFTPALYELGRLAGEAQAPAAMGADALRRFLSIPAWPDDPPRKNAWLLLGRVEARRGRTESAREALEIALDMDPGWKPARAELDALPEPAD